MFPGDSIFVSVYHPFKSIEQKQITGEAFFKLNAIGKVVERIPSEDCKAVKQDFYSIKAAHERYELW